MTPWGETNRSIAASLTTPPSSAPSAARSGLGLAVRCVTAARRSAFRCSRSAGKSTIAVSPLASPATTASRNRLAARRGDTYAHAAQRIGVGRALRHGGAQIGLQVLAQRREIHDRRQPIGVAGDHGIAEPLGREAGGHVRPRRAGDDQKDHQEDSASHASFLPRLTFAGPMDSTARLFRSYPALQHRDFTLLW